MSEPKRTRPLMQNYGISKEDKGLMAWQWVDEQLSKARNYWICSTHDGKPHAAPVWGLWDAGKLYFGSSRSSRKGRNLAANPNVVIHLESGDDTLIFEGIVEEIRDSEVLKRISKSYSKKYGMPGLALSSEGDSVCYLLKPELAYSWLEKDFPNTATRWQFEE